LERIKIDHEWIKLLASQGHSRKDVVSITGYCASTVNGSFWRQDLDPIYCQWHKHLEAIKALALAGMTREEIARALGISYSQVVNSIIRHVDCDVAHKTRKIPVEDRALIDELYNVKGWSQEKIGKLYEASGVLVSQYMKRHNIPVRHQGRPPQNGSADTI
jgi:hypothetical protein